MASKNQAPPDLLNMTIEELFPKKWLHPDHLMNRTVQVVIIRASVEKVWDNRSNDHTFKNCLWFENKQKGLLLNQTQTIQLLNVTGGNTVAECVGATVVLRPTIFRGKRTIAIDPVPESAPWEDEG